LRQARLPPQKFFLAFLKTPEGAPKIFPLSKNIFTKTAESFSPQPTASRSVRDADNEAGFTAASRQKQEKMM